MNPDWKSFLVNSGAVIENEQVFDFGDAVAENRMAMAGNTLCDLNHQGLISAQGEEAEPFLQSQFTNDIRLVSEGRSQLSSYLNPKGRMLTIFRVFRRKRRYYLMMPAELIAPTLNRIRLFILRAKVTLENADEELVRFGVAGPEAEKAIKHTLGEAPGAVDAVVHASTLSVVRLPGLQPRFAVLGETEMAKSLWTQLAKRFMPVGADPWALMDIMAGIPTIYTQTMGDFVPQMANLELVNGVSFQKGCYPGQEIVARMRYLGILKRRMYRVHADINSRLEPGTDLVVPEEATPEGAGKIVDARPYPEGGYEALAVVQTRLAGESKIRLGGTEGPALQYRPLPYSVDNTR